MRAYQNLEQGAQTFEERNKLYGDNYLRFGKLCNALFPAGIEIRAGDEAGWNRLGLFVQCVSKLSRYAENIECGGHIDSAHDLMVYAAMLEEVSA